MSEKSWIPLVSFFVAVLVTVKDILPPLRLKNGSILIDGILVVGWVLFAAGGVLWMSFFPYFTVIVPLMYWLLSIHYKNQSKNLSDLKATRRIIASIFIIIIPLSSLIAFS
ncbi:MAG: hypothetical protein AAGC77_09670 [Pseudomonadota bacterium]